MLEQVESLILVFLPTYVLLRVHTTEPLQPHNSYRLQESRQTQSVTHRVTAHRQLTGGTKTQRIHREALKTLRTTTKEFQSVPQQQSAELQLVSLVLWPGAVWQSHFRNTAAAG